MLISTGKVSPSEPWRILEVAMNQAPDVLALRLSKELKRLHDPAEVLVPMTPNASGTMEWVVEHVYVRGLNGSLSRLARTPGIDFTRKEHATPEWIATLISTESAQPVPPAVGTFVRVLGGPCARMCGTVTHANCETITVSIPMRTKAITVYTLPYNLQVLECPPDKQSFYYSAELV